MPVVDRYVVWDGAASGVDRVVDGALQSRLVALDLQQVVGASFPGDVFRGVVLGVRGIGGDDRIHQVGSAQQLLDCVISLVSSGIRSDVTRTSGPK